MLYKMSHRSLICIAAYENLVSRERFTGTDGSCCVCEFYKNNNSDIIARQHVCNLFKFSSRSGIIWEACASQILCSMLHNSPSISQWVKIYVSTPTRYSWCDIEANWNKLIQPRDIPIDWSNFFLQEHFVLKWSKLSQ